MSWTETIDLDLRQGGIFPKAVPTLGMPRVSVDLYNLSGTLSTGEVELVKHNGPDVPPELVRSFASGAERSSAGSMLSLDVHDASHVSLRVNTTQSGVRVRANLYGHDERTLTFDDEDEGLLGCVDPHEGALHSTLAPDNGYNGYQNFVSNRGYFVYIGRVTTPRAFRYVGLYIDTGGTGTGLVSEVGLFSSPSPPNYTAQTLTKIERQDITLSTSNAFSSSSPFSTVVPAGTHLWAGIRAAGFSGAPNYNPLQLDHAQGRVLFKSAVGSFASLSTTTTSLYNAASVLTGPDLRVQV